MAGSRCALASAEGLNPFVVVQSKALAQEQWKASVRAKVEHPFRALKRQFGCAKVRYRG